MYPTNIRSGIPWGPEATPAAEPGLDRPALMALCARQEAEIDSLCAEILARYEEATFVYRLGEQIGSVQGECAIAGLVVRDAATVLGARAAELWLQNGTQLVRAASIPDLPDVEPTLAVRETIMTGRVFVREAGSGSEASATVALPDGQGSSFGALVLNGRVGGRSYLTGEIRLLSAIAALAAAFIRNERLAENARGAEARKQESEIAREVHRGLLPRHDPRVPGLDISGGFKAADGLGGDYYGYVTMADGSLGVAIADVSGHGVGAALFMAIAKGALENEARDTLSAGGILGRVNEVLACEFRGTDMFTTSVFARFLPEARRFVWSNAGHNPPLLLRATGEIEHLEPCGPALGLLATAQWRDVETPFDPGDVLLLYTDGVVEARDADKRLFGVERLIEAARRPAACAADIREAVLASIAAHLCGAPAGDDVTLVVARGVAGEGSP